MGLARAWNGPNFVHPLLVIYYKALTMVMLKLLKSYVSTNHIKKQATLMVAKLKFLATKLVKCYQY